MKYLVIILSILIQITFSLRTQNQMFLTKTNLHQSQDAAENVDLNADDVPTINSPSANEEEQIDDDELEASCSDLISENHPKYNGTNDTSDEEEESLTSSSNSTSTNETQPCDTGRELTEEQLQACQDFCEDGDCECVDACHDLMEFVGDAATGLLSYLAEYFQQMNEMRSLAAQAYQSAILNTLGNFYGVIEDSTNSLSSAFDFDLGSDTDSDDGIDLSTDEDSEYTDEIEDASNDTSSSDDEECECECEDKESDENGNPCACAHLMNSKQKSPVLQIVGSALSSNAIEDSNSTSF